MTDPNKITYNQQDQQVETQYNIAGDKIIHNYITSPAELPPLFRNVPAMPNHFVGRDEMLGTLITQLTSGQALALSAEGLGGVGKTTLAVALAHQQTVLKHFKDGVLWAGLGPQAGESELMSTLAAWALALGQDISGLIDLTERKQAVKQLIGQRALLLIIDDVWQLDTATNLRCGGPHCCHLLTTRNKTIGHQFAGAANAQSVTSLAEDPAYTLLQALAPEACAADPQASKELAQAVGGLPLALELLGGYLAETETDLFPELFDDLAGEALTELSDPKQRLQLAQKRLGSRDAQVSLQDTLALSLAELSAQEKAAFYALGAFAPKPEYFSRQAAEAVTQTTGKTLLKLAARNLLKYFRRQAAKTVTKTTGKTLLKLAARNLLEVEGKQLALHQVLANVAKTGMDDEAVERHRVYYLSLANEDRKDWHRIEGAYGQIKWGWQATTDDKRRLEWVWAVRTYQRLRGLWSDQLEWDEAGLAAVRTLGQRNNEGAMLIEIGMVYHNLGQRDKALDYLQQALPISEAVGDRAMMATTLNNIGHVYDVLGQRDKALDYLQQALPISEDVGDRYQESITRYNMATIYRAEGRLAEAVAQLKRVVELDRLVQHPDLESDMALLAQVQAELAQQ